MHRLNSLELTEEAEVLNAHQLEIAASYGAAPDGEDVSEIDAESGRCEEKSFRAADGSAIKCRDNSNLVGWDGESDPANPMNWPVATKWMTTGIVSLITFIVPLASSMFAPAVAQLMEEFHVSNELLGALVVSVYVLGLAFGPLVLAPLSEVYGRWIVYAVSNVLYVVLTIACGVSNNLYMMIVWRFLAGCVGSSPLAIGAGTIADLFPLEQRGMALSLYSLGPISGPAIGPVIGGFLAEAKGWRWVFWLLAVLSGVTTIAQISLMRETYAVTLLARKTERLQRETGNLQLRSKLDSNMPPREILLRAIVRPTKLTLLSPINILLSLASAFIYGILYLLLTTFPLVFESQYGFSPGISGLTYIGLGVGNLVGLAIFSMTSDRYIGYRSAQGKLKPEDRLPFFLLAGPLIAAGLFWYGWSADNAAHVHWIVPILGSSFVGLGNMFFFLPVMGYLVDAFTVYAASAFAANTVLRSIGGALLPLAGSSLYTSVGVGWGNSILGFLMLAFCPALVALYLYGEKIRLRYPLEL